jgi:hypothetical protein
MRSRPCASQGRRRVFEITEFIAKKNFEVSGSFRGSAAGDVMETDSSALAAFATMAA